MSARPLEGRVLVTGAAGMLGSQLLLTAPRGVEAVGTDLVPAPPGNPVVARPGVDLGACLAQRVVQPIVQTTFHNRLAFSKPRLAREKPFTFAGDGIPVGGDGLALALNRRKLLIDSGEMSGEL